MRACLPSLAALALCLALSSCSFTPDVPKPQPDTTTLRRFDGEPLRRRDIQARRTGAIALARALMHIERELREPWIEARDAAVLIEHAAAGNPSEIQSARDLWRLSEPVPPGVSRGVFSEYGFYADPMPGRQFTPPISPADFEAAIAQMLGEHNDGSEKALLLAGWRHFSPEVVQRRDNYLAAAWRLELGGASVGLCESLLGPHRRSQVYETGHARLAGSNGTLEGYAAPDGVLETVAPGPPSPVSAAIDALAKATGNARPLPLEVDGPAVRIALSDEDRAFLVSALKGLSEGCCDLAWLPRSTERIEVTFDYLVGNAEARATLGFSRTERGWVLNKLIYEPAAAAVVGRQGAALDLIAMLRASEPAGAVANPK